MKFKIKSFIYILLIMAPLQSLDFTPTWVPYVLGATLLCGMFFNVHSIIVTLYTFISSYLILQTYHFKVSPESTVNLLTLLIAGRLLQGIRHGSTLYILSLLWIGSWTIFNNNLFYICYLFFSICIIQVFFTFNPESPLKLNSFKTIKSNYFKVALSVPMIAILFFIFPRYNNFTPYATSPSTGEVGYASEVNNSSAGNLQLSNKIAFYVQMEKKLPPETLYWRGRVLSITDGYNWRQASNIFPRIPSKLKSKQEQVRYTLKTEQNFNKDMITLEHPSTIISSTQNFYHNQFLNSYHFYRNNRKSITKAISQIHANLIQPLKNKEHFIKLPSFIPHSLSLIYEKIKAQNTAQFLKNLSNYLLDNDFKYTLQPEVMPTMHDFIRAKQGFCTHYASLTAILLRKHGVPVRLVSGFQGGEYNEFGKFYIIKSNDAHAWVEYYSNGAWRRFDPTRYLSPTRIVRGTNFFLQVSQEQSILFKFLKDNFYEIQSYVNHINFKLMSFMDNFDRDQQKAIAKKFKLKLSSYYILGGIFLIFFLILVFGFILFRQYYNQPKDQKALKKFIKRCKQKGVILSNYEAEGLVIESLKKHKLPSAYIDFMQAYQNYKYRNSENLDELNSILKKLN